MTVVSPASFRHFGIAYGDGIANNLRAQPVAGAAAAALPALVRARCAPGGARDADVVHAHWLPSAVAGPRHAASRSSSRPGDRTSSSRSALPWLFRPLLRRARVVVCASSSLAADAPGARRARRARDPERRRPAGRGRRRPRSRRTSSTSAGSRRRRAFASSPRRPPACRSSSSATGRCATSCRRPSASCRTTSSAPTTSARRWSACPRGARGTASPPARRWRTAGRS